LPAADHRSIHLLEILDAVLAQGAGIVGGQLLALVLEAADLAHPFVALGRGGGSRASAMFGAGTNIYYIERVVSTPEV
jgi:hypothetical protein